MKIRNCRENDADKIAEIYNHYILNSIATFEEHTIDSAQMLARIRHNTQDYPWLVCEDDNQILGYAYASTWKSRSAYRYTAETTIYIDANGVKKGIGRSLYTALLQELSVKKIRVVLACISLPNEASIKLHEKLGFKKVSHFHEVGRKFDRWIDVEDWQLKL